MPKTMWAFWDTQPVPKMKEVINQLNLFKLTIYIYIQTISDEDLAEWKVVLVSRRLSMEPLEDEDVVSEKIPDTGPDVLYGTHDRSFIGFFHENKNPRRTHAHLHRGTYTGGSVATIKMNI